MQPYKNLSGDSGVTAYEIRPRAIVVRFQDGWSYEYTDVSVSPAAIREMRRLALEGRGLSTYISQNVRQAYASKFR